MIRKRNNNGHLLILTLIGILILSLSAFCSSCTCIPLFDLIVENQTENELTIYVNDYKVGNVGTGENITDSFSLDTGRFYIVAKDKYGAIIYSKTFTLDQMQEIESRVYKVVIPSSQNST